MKNYLLAIFVPCVIFIMRDQLIRAFIALGLQVSGAGWFIASVWALFGARQLNKFKNYEEHLDELARKND